MRSRPRLIQRSLPAKDDRRLRAHLVACPECRAQYRAAMGMAAQMGRALRDARLEKERSRRHGELARRALAAGSPLQKRRFGLRLMLLPAAFILLIALWMRVPEENTLRVAWNGGEVLAGGQRMSAERALLPIAPGEWCQTKGNARARIDSGPGGSCVIELGIGTQLLVEETTPIRLRLQRGELQLAGPCLVTCVFGVLELDHGNARLTVSDGTYDLECLEGEVSWVESTGRRTLRAGERIEGGVE